MPFAVTHVLIPIILVDLFRDHVLKKPRMLPNKFIYLASFAGLLPDLDLPLQMLLTNFFAWNIESHRLIFHNIWIPLAAFAGFLIAYYLFKRKTLGKIFLMVFIGTALHLVLDVTVYGSIYPFLPLNEYSFGINLLPSYEAYVTIMLSVDAILLLLWLAHEEFEHKISDYF